MKGKKPISIPENEVITSVDTEDYLEENSDEDYDDMMKKDNLTGEFQKLRINAQLLTQPVARSRTACRRKMWVHMRQASASCFLQSHLQQMRVREELPG